MEAVCDREVRCHQASLVGAVESNNTALSAAVTRAASKKAAIREAERIVLKSDVVPPIHFKPGVRKLLNRRFTWPGIGEIHPFVSRMS